MLIALIQKFNFMQTEKIESKKQALNKIYKYYEENQHPVFNFNLTKIVPGVGDLDSRIVFLGEGPGAEEDKQGVPFVGRAGQLLTKIIESIRLERSNVYITNVVKCRLENNRPPTLDEIDYEKKIILDEELKIVAPKLICTLGASATKALLGHDVTISKVRGKFIDIEKYTVIPTYHPAYLLRNPSAKKIVWEDMKKIALFLKNL